MPRLVLIDSELHYEHMLALVLIPILVVAAFLVYAAGVDSRIDDVARRRGFHGH
jgi:hypothetical protein